MDVFSHGLWAGALYKAANLKTGKRLKVWLAVILTIAPDIFAFAPIFFWFFWNLAFGKINWGDWPDPASKTFDPALAPINQLTDLLYNLSHSLFIFLAVAVLIFILKRKIVWELGGWLMNILIDIPTHSAEFYPTPFLWPFSDFRVNGFSWGNIWFEIINYALIILVYILIWTKSRKLKNI